MVLLAQRVTNTGAGGGAGLLGALAPARVSAAWLPQLLGCCVWFAASQGFHGALLGPTPRSHIWGSYTPSPAPPTLG